MVQSLLTGKIAPNAAVKLGAFVLDTLVDLDVAAAHEGGARAVAVATGPFGQSDLAVAGADAVLADLRDTDALVQAALVD